jgi:hypothetical protein
MDDRCCTTLQVKNSFPTLNKLKFHVTLLLVLEKYRDNQRMCISFFSERVFSFLVAGLFHYSTWIAIVEEISHHKLLYFGNV